LKVRKAAGVVFTLLLTAALLYWFAGSADMGRVFREAAGASPGFIALAVAGEVVSILLKAYRMRLMLRPVRERAPFAPLLKATVVSFAMSGVLPGRVGELAKPFLLARWLGLPFSPLLATALLERVMDLVALVLLWVAFVFWGLSHVAPSGAAYFPYFNALTGLVLVAFVLTGVALAWLAPRRRVFQRGIRHSGRMKRHPWLARVLFALLKFSEGLGMFRRKRDILAVVACSLATWGVLVITSWAVVEALHISIPLSGGIVLLLLVSLGAGLPTPGGVGGVHKAISFGLVTFYAVGVDEAVAVGIVGHAAMFFPGILWGLLYLAAGKVQLSELKEELRTADSRELVESPGEPVD
jgi:uncharacterized protein (TIRG00374 family)